RRLALRFVAARSRNLQSGGDVRRGRTEYPLKGIAKRQPGACKQRLRGGVTDSEPRSDFLDRVTLDVFPFERVPVSGRQPVEHGLYETAYFRTAVGLDEVVLVRRLQRFDGCAQLRPGSVPACAWPSRGWPARPPGWLPRRRRDAAGQSGTAGQSDRRRTHR